MKKNTLLCLAIFAVTSCSTTPRPITHRDKALIEAASNSFVVWQVTQPIGNRPKAVLAVLFDGTNNDRYHVPKGERQTVIADIEDELNAGGQLVKPARYYPGPGTESSKLEAEWDAAFGTTTASIASKACTDTLSDIENIRRAAPTTDIRIFVSGFSRGAAAARHFMNILEKGCAPLSAGTDPNVHFYAVLFDTVATGQRNNLQLQIPSSVDQVVNFISLDERRIFFSPILDAGAAPDRVLTIPLPGVHSDVGMSYGDGVGFEYAPIVQRLLSEMGLVSTNRIAITEDYFLQGEHDSRWTIDRILGVDPAGSQKDHDRKKYYVAATKLSPRRELEWQARQVAMAGDSHLFEADSERFETPAFAIHRQADGFQISTIPDEYGRTFFTEPTLVLHDHSGCIEYLVVHGAWQRISVPYKVVQRLKKQTPHELEVGVVFNSNILYTWWLADDKVIARAKPTIGKCAAKSNDSRMLKNF
ncbi:phospholipase effector Tle1 domain-containing protein [Dyella flagellata]|uniref:T6SS Phospholipase effector Tle1-like catalytic domain-containing protein n=1 Tax=Dyella flagellata TaxID=1867833 RepID=A0ABQ5X9D5_9GAMM|nr:DUF2235 domain-containing protein [Dyella flagellata]GLQ88190.1 hypothetical protein GCM10007898_17590 [Dyella flagellata]